MPSCAVLSDAFEPQMAFTARQLGLEAVGFAMVKHPVSDQSVSQMQAKAEAIFEDVVAALTATPRPFAAGDAVGGDAATAKVEAACAT